MKTFTLCLFLAFSYFSIAQTKAKKIKAYKVIVITQNEQIEGFLHSADTSQLNVLEDVKNGEPNLISVNNTDIKIIKIGKKGSVVRGAVIGTVIGGTIGYLIGYSGGDDESEEIFDPFTFSKEEKGIFGAIFLGAAGGGIGALIGLGKKKIDVDFSATKYLNSLNVIRHYSMVKIDL